MKIGFVINDYQTEMPAFTTTGLALQASKMGHEIYYIAVEDFIYTNQEQMGAHSRKAPKKQFRTQATFWDSIKGTKKKLITAKELDVLFLRNDPSADGDRPWAQHAGIVFGQLAKNNGGVITLNNPETLAKAFNKMYFQYFPQSIRPETIITRNLEDIRAFYNAHQKNIILKPLQGSGGKNVFLLNEENKNFNQIVDVIFRDGFVVAQEYLPAAKKGDIRLFLLDGRPIVVEGKIAAIHRVNAPGDIRSNIHQGGSVKTPKITKRTKEIIEEVAPKLIRDGMFLVGIDIVEDKVMEVNVFSPGGLGHAGRIHKVDFYEPVIKAIEKKIS